MQNYGFSVIEAGLSFLGLGVGSMLGVVLFSLNSDKYIKKKAQEDDAKAAAEGREPEGMKPEYRLPPLKYGAVLLPAGLFIYGWTAEKQVHWIAPIIGTAVIGVGNLLIFMVRSINCHSCHNWVSEANEPQGPSDVPGRLFQPLLGICARG
jgi:hypothetical protein